MKRKNILCYFLVLIYGLYLHNTFGYVLITTLYNEKNLQRRNEYLTCLKINFEHPLIEKIHILYDIGKEQYTVDDFLAVLQKLDIEISLIKGRISYEKCFILANNLYPNKKIIISNADIYFNETLKLLENLTLKNIFLALTRWNTTENGELVPFYKERKIEGEKVMTKNISSQDTWIFETPLHYPPCSNIFLGIRHCDGMIAYQMKNAGFQIFNPCLTIQCCHLHLSNLRHYNQRLKPPKERINVEWQTLDQVKEYLVEFSQ